MRPVTTFFKFVDDVCRLEPIDKDSEEFQMIVDYTKNTHASTHRQYGLEVEEVFRADRGDEAGAVLPLML